jgi:hypothetical protein
MVVEVAVSGGDRPGSDGGVKWYSDCFGSGRGRGAEFKIF